MNGLLKIRISILALLAVAVLFPQHSFAQGCILTRNMSPVLGAQLSPYLQKGEMQISSNYRQFTADTQYQRTDLSQPVTQNNTQVISKMRYMEVDGAYAITPEWNLTVGVPLIVLASSNRALPSTVPGSQRFAQSTTGFGDILFGVRHWFMKLRKQSGSQFFTRHRREGADRRQQCARYFPERARSWTSVTAWWISLFSLVMEAGDSICRRRLQADRQLERFRKRSLPVQPADPERHPISTINAGSGRASGAIDPKERYNTVSDSYLVRGGVGYPIPRIEGDRLPRSRRVLKAFR